MQTGGFAGREPWERNVSRRGRGIADESGRGSRCATARQRAKKIGDAGPEQVQLKSRGNPVGFSVSNGCTTNDPTSDPKKNPCPLPGTCLKEMVRSDGNTETLPKLRTIEVFFFLAWLALGTRNLAWQLGSASTDSASLGLAHEDRHRDSRDLSLLGLLALLLTGQSLVTAGNNHRITLLSAHEVHTAVITAFRLVGSRHCEGSRLVYLW